MPRHYGTTLFFEAGEPMCAMGAPFIGQSKLARTGKIRRIFCLTCGGEHWAAISYVSVSLNDRLSS